MAMNYKEIPKGYVVPEEDQLGVGLVNNFVDSLVKSGLLSKKWKLKTEAVATSATVFTPETSVGAPTWEQMAENMAERFASELGLSKEAYIDSLPQFGAQPEEYRGRFDIPVIVETRLPVARLVELSGLTSYIDASRVVDWKKGKFQTPEVPYVAWVNDGSVNRNKSVDKVRKALAQDERGGNIYDGVALYLRNPDILKDHYLDIPGSQTGSDDAPYLHLWHGRPELNGYFTDRAGPDWGSVVAGVKIETKQLAA